MKVTAPSALPQNSARVKQAPIAQAKDSFPAFDVHSEIMPAGRQSTEKCGPGYSNRACQFCKRGVTRRNHTNQFDGFAHGQLRTLRHAASCNASLRGAIFPAEHLPRDVSKVPSPNTRIYASHAR